MFLCASRAFPCDIPKRTSEHLKSDTLEASLSVCMFKKWFWIFPEGLLFHTSDVYRLQAGEISFILSLIKPTDLSLTLIGEEIKLQRISGFTHPADFNQIGNHDDSCRVLLPNHPPEVIDGLLHRT